MKPAAVYLWIGVAVAGLLSCSKIAQIGGGNDGGDGNGDPTQAPYIGNWLSDCQDLGNLNRIYLEINADSSMAMAFLDYSGPNCSGTYELVDVNGNPILEPEIVRSYQELTVTDIPENLYALEITRLTDLFQFNVLWFVNDIELFELSTFSRSYDTWVGWQGEADVLNFASDPQTYEPFYYEKLRFSRTELP